MKLTGLFDEFISSEKAGGFILLACTLISITIANTPFGQHYVSLWNLSLGDHSLSHWINDGLMAIFFLLIGLELEREIYIGELSTLKKALLPVIAAVGGMLFPAAIHLFFNHGTPTQAGAGIPMATDIAFSLGILALLGKGIHPSLKIFLTALAVIDDLGAILVIAFFYSKTISFVYLGIAAILFLIMLIFNKLKILNLLFYLIPGIGMWYCMLHSGVHATIAGVLLAFVIPFSDGAERSISYRLQHWLHKPVAFIILPLFALANTALVFSQGTLATLISLNSIGIIAGLLVGKVSGISLLSFIAVKLKISNLPTGMNWKHMIGVGLLGGIGFTMSIFISLLAFEDSHIIDSSKIAILVGSLISGFAGFMLLKFFHKSRN